MYYYIIILGLMMILTIPVMAKRDGVTCESDFLLWLKSKPLDFILNVKVMIMGGLGLVIVGVTMMVAP